MSPSGRAVLPSVQAGCSTDAFAHESVCGHIGSLFAMLQFASEENPVTPRVFQQDLGWEQAFFLP